MKPSYKSLGIVVKLLEPPVIIILRLTGSTAILEKDVEVPIYVNGIGCVLHKSKLLELVRVVFPDKSLIYMT